MGFREIPLERKQFRSDRQDRTAAAAAVVIAFT
jgi:hypothetical protein